MKRRFGNRKTHAVIFMVLTLIVAGLVGVGIFRCDHKSFASPEAELCEVLYQID